MHLHHYLLASSLLLLLACGSDNPQTSTPPSPAPEEELAQEAPIEAKLYEFDFFDGFNDLKPNSDLAAIQAVFGADNVKEGIIYLGEGMEMPGFIVYEGQASELNIFRPEMSEEAPELNVLIREPASPWVSTEGIRIGTSLEELIRLNEAPINFSGFGWDYGGYISNWNGGRLNGRAIRLEMGPTTDGTYPTELLGDVVLSSDSPMLKEVSIYVGEMEIRLDDNPIKVSTYTPYKYFDRIRPGMTRSALLDLYGPEALRDSQIHIGEGEFVSGAFLFPGTPAEVQILYQETSPHAIASIKISDPDSPFYLEDIYQLFPGLDLPGLVALNGKHFEFAGFGWDSEGTVLDWQGGELEGMGVVLRPLNYDELPERFIGDIPLMSSDLNPEEMLNFEVVEITIPL